jgi:hypothetical protein
VGICVLWALVHSVLASEQSKDLALRISGSRYRDGLYRFAFNAQSVVSLVWAALRFSRLPDREHYRVGTPWSWFFRASQAASLGVLLSGVRVMGILRFARLTSLQDLLAGRDVRRAPEAQGPPLGSDEEEVVKAGPFRFSRHLGNLGALGFFLFLPRMTANRASYWCSWASTSCWVLCTRSTGCGRPMASPTSATGGRCRFWSPVAQEARHTQWAFPVSRIFIQRRLGRIRRRMRMPMTSRSDDQDGHGYVVNLGLLLRRPEAVFARYGVLLARPAALTYVGDTV